MKKTLYTLMAVLALGACSRKEAAPEATGSLRLAITPGEDYRTKASDVDVNDFRIAISRNDGWGVSYDRFGDMPSVLELGTGDYTVTVTSAESRPAAFDRPVYGAVEDFVIRAGEVTALSLTCTLQNMKVSFSLSENFRKELSDYTVVVTNAATWEAADAGVRTLTWSKADLDAGKAGYFTVAPLMVKVDAYRSIDNSETHSQLNITDVAARDHHIILLDARVTGKVNGIHITVDESVNEKNTDIFIPGWEEKPVDGGDKPGDDDPDDPEPSTAPKMTWTANPDFAPMALAPEMDVDILIEAQEGIRDFVVSVDSGVLSDVVASLGQAEGYSYAQDGPYDMDLIGNAALVSTLATLGVPTGDHLAGQTSVNFSLSSLVPMILVYNPESGSNHIFTLHVTDQKGQSLTKAVTFVMP